MLTLEQLKQMPPHVVFMSGEIENGPDGVYMTTNNIGKMLLWVAKRGGIEDWAIYIHWAEMGKEYVKDCGDKVTNPDNIKMLVPCNDEAFAAYRY